MKTITVNAASGARVQVEVDDDARYPMRAHFERVTVTGSNNRIVSVGRQVVVSMSDESREYCPHHGTGHRSSRTASACAIRMVDRLNREAGINLRAYKEA